MIRSHFSWANAVVRWTAVLAVAASVGSSANNKALPNTEILTRPGLGSFVLSKWSLDPDDPYHYLPAVTLTIVNDTGVAWDGVDFEAKIKGSNGTEGRFHFWISGGDHGWASGAAKQVEEPIYETTGSQPPVFQAPLTLTVDFTEGTYRRVENMPVISGYVTPDRACMAAVVRALGSPAAKQQEMLQELSAQRCVDEVSNAAVTILGNDAIGRTEVYRAKVEADGVASLGWVLASQVHAGSISRPVRISPAKDIDADDITQ